MATMAVVHIGPQEPCHHRRDFARVAQFHQQVKVVGHQAIMKDSKPESVAVSRHQVEECPTIVIIAEDRLTVVATDHQVKACFL
jgi:hypothetical protein